MIKVKNPALLTKCTTKAKIKFDNLNTFAANNWIITRYLSKGGEFVQSDDKDKLEAEKTAALDTISDALEDKGFTKIDDNAFIVGQAKLQTKTIANLLAINNMPWYQYLFDTIKLTANNTQIQLNKGDYFSISSWDAGDALITGAKLGVKSIRVPTNVAYTLVKCARSLSGREKKYTSFKASKVEAADKKLSKNSPPEAHFHRGMREYHKECCRNCDKNSEKYKMHKQYVEHHNKLYKKAMH